MEKQLVNWPEPVAVFVLKDKGEKEGIGQLGQMLRGGG